MQYTGGFGVRPRCSCGVGRGVDVDTRGCIWSWVRGGEESRRSLVCRNWKLVLCVCSGEYVYSSMIILMYMCV